MTPDEVAKQLAEEDAERASAFKTQRPPQMVCTMCGGGCDVERGGIVMPIINTVLGLVIGGIAAALIHWSAAILAVLALAYFWHRSLTPRCPDCGGHLIPSDSPVGRRLGR